MRYAAVVSYDGTAFCGWQRQLGVASVQQSLEEALSKLCATSIPIVAAGRTDAGVHSRGQVVSFSLPSFWEPRRLVLAINFYLPETVRIMGVFPVEESFSARFCALWREYRYYIWHGPAFPPYLAQRAWWNRWQWDKTAVKKACEYLEGTHDFKAFCPIKECPGDTVRTILRIKYLRSGHLSVITVRGNSFLMNMVRSIVGSLDLVGKGKNDPEWIKELLDDEKKDRTYAGMTAPAHGLYFWKVCYNAHCFLTIPEIREREITDVLIPSDFA